MSLMAKTRHPRSSGLPSQESRSLLFRLSQERRLPDRGVHASTDRMLDTLTLILAGGSGTQYEANKLADWMRRFPYKVDAALTEDWPKWKDQERAERIADAVMLQGWSKYHAAAEFGTTRQTVDDIVRVARERIRRSL